MRLSLYVGALGLLAHPASAADRSCVETIKQLSDAVDCQETEAIRDLVWPEAEGLYGLILGGPCPKYRTYLREVKSNAVTGNRQVVTLKAIVTRVTDYIENGGSYTGDYSVVKMRYVCERRSGEWRILSEGVISRVDGVNEAAARDYRRSRSRIRP